MANPEEEQRGPESFERGRETAEAAGERAAEALRNKAEKEKIPETSPEDKQEALERATAEAKEAAPEDNKEKPGETAEKESEPVRQVSKRDKEKALETTLNHARRHMRASERTFSKVVHNKAVERVSDVAGKTIARPNAILGGGIAAFVLTIIVYIVARTFGYPLSGFETISTFIIGFLLGILYDFLKAMITGKKME